MFQSGHELLRPHHGASTLMGVIPGIPVKHVHRVAIVLRVVALVPLQHALAICHHAKMNDGNGITIAVTVIAIGPGVQMMVCVTAT